MNVPGLTRAFVDELFAAQPSFATWAGEHSHDAALEPFTAAWLSSERARLASWREKLAAATGETPAENADLATLRGEVERGLFTLDEERAPERDPLWHLGTLGNAFHTLLAREVRPTGERFAALASRLAALPDALQAARGLLGPCARPSLEVAASQALGLVELVAEAERQAPPEWREKLARPAAEAKVAAHQHAAALSALAASATADFRLGEALLAKKLSFALGEARSPSSLAAAARAELGTLRAELAELSRAAGARSTGDDAIREALAQAAQSRSSPERLKDDAAAQLAGLTAFLADTNLFPQPDAALSVEWTPAFMRGVAVAMLDAPGPLDAGQRAFFYVTPPPDDWPPERVESLLREYNSRGLQMLAIHEAYPGHHVQLALSNRCPSLARTLFVSGAFVEGWAVYGEHAVLEAGYGRHDALLPVVAKKLYLRAVTNALLDCELHAGNLTEVEAMDLLVKGAFQEEGEARGKWRRAQVTSAQLSTYWVGYRQVRALRERWTAKNPSAGLDHFHEEVLSHGSPHANVLADLAGL